MRSGFDVILNRNARRLRPGSALGRALAEAALRAGARLHETTTPEQLDDAARTARKARTRAVVLAGGDGSCMMGVTALARAYENAVLPQVAFAPAGTVCTVARNFGVAGRGAAARVLSAVGAGRVRSISSPTLLVRDGAGERRVGFIFGAGLVAAFFQVYDASPRQGLGPAAAIAARVFAGSLIGTAFARRVLAKTPALLTVDGVVQPGDAFSLIVASVVPDLGLHLLLTYRAREDEGRFHVVASGLSPSALGPQMLRVLLGRPLTGTPRVDAVAGSLEVQFASRVAPYILDGEAFAAGAVTVNAGPSLSVLVPQTNDD